jgi:hypothetical protein
VCGGEAAVAAKQSYRANIAAWIMIRADIPLPVAIVLALAAQIPSRFPKPPCGSRSVLWRRAVNEIAGTWVLYPLDLQ